MYEVTAKADGDAYQLESMALAKDVPASVILSILYQAMNLLDDYVLEGRAKAYGEH